MDHLIENAVSAITQLSQLSLKKPEGKRKELNFKF